jgi:hypothetical protein
MDDRWLGYTGFASRWSADAPSEPLSDAEVEAVRGCLVFYRRDSLIARLVATVDALRGTDDERTLRP